MTAFMQSPFVQACQDTLDGAAELARMLEDNNGRVGDWPPEAVQYALMLLEDYLTQWQEQEI